MAASPFPIARDDTLLGACYAIGEDFGFNPVYLRILFAVAIFWSPPITLSAYAGLTALVTLTRWLVPDPVPAEPEPEAKDDRRVEADRPYAAWLDELPLAA